MDNIYAPWRDAYFGSHSESECVFCEIANNESNDLQNRVFYRDSHIFGVMNRYPYTPGHFMLLPLMHCDSPESMPLELWLHLQTKAHKACEILYEYGAQGINMGLNIKRAGGAGIPAHLHMHFVPRFIGDTNFMTSIANARTYGKDFDSVYESIKDLSKKYLA